MKHRKASQKRLGWARYAYVEITPFTMHACSRWVVGGKRACGSRYRSDGGDCDEFSHTFDLIASLDVPILQNFQETGHRLSTFHSR